MTTADLKARLDQLAQHLQRAEAKLKRQDIFSADHKIKALELQERYEALSRKVHAEIAEAEAHGHHVSDLERSVREWLDSLEMDMD
ncbi:3-ketoacyl-ACP reductase [Roseovarius sp. ZX-A-9]|uniref:3-ketoacyl-ACP reductase n=1 Tax=Roseovarius sp. ZX-A-9 TaxID=3014783 RepID=UPI00232C569C|nr:3-ketoacyl-ACP reductase [Roseovarius sp. ZX-A-9]